MRSLFWRFATAFFLVLLTSLLLQALVIVSVVHPITDRRAKVEAAALGDDIAAEIATRGTMEDAAIGEVLRRRTRGREPALVLFRGIDGALVTGHPLPPGGAQRFTALLETGEDRWPEPLASASPDLPLPQGNLPRRAPRLPLEIAGSSPVLRDGVLLGEVFVLAPGSRFALWPHTLPRPLLLFFPVAIALSGAAAFVMFRIIVRRLRSLEGLATRVSEGDFSAQVDDPTSDEIGRLALRLNVMTEKLKEARDRVEGSDRARRRLFADIAHELATPMTSLKGYAETLTDPDVSVSAAERDSYVRSVLEETNRLDALIKDLFELTRLEAGAIHLERDRLDAAEMLRNVVRRYEPRFRAAGLALEWRGGEGRAFVDADGRRLEQVAENLLRNALRYVPVGGTVAATVRPGAPGTRHRFEIEDDGPGIPEENLERIFERFFRGSAARTDGGTGLGLAIAREIVERHDGTIRAENREEGGARFILELPSA